MFQQFIILYICYSIVRPHVQLYTPGIIFIIAAKPISIAIPFEMVRVGGEIWSLLDEFFEKLLPGNCFLFF